MHGGADVLVTDHHKTNESIVWTVSVCVVTGRRLCLNRPIRVHAQRKFASCSSSITSSPGGSLLYNAATVCSPSDQSTADQSPGAAVRKLIAVGRRPNTDDFLTFLCLRGALNSLSLVCLSVCLHVCYIDRCCDNVLHSSLVTSSSRNWTEICRLHLNISLLSILVAATVVLSSVDVHWKVYTKM